MSLEELRKRIDELDFQLVKLLNERARVVVEIGKLKNKTDRPVYAPAPVPAAGQKSVRNPGSIR